MAPPARKGLLVDDHAGQRFARELVGHLGVLHPDVLLRVVEHLVLGLAANRLTTCAVDRFRHESSSQAAAGPGSGRTSTVSTTLITSSAGRPAREACSRTLSGLVAW